MSSTHIHSLVRGRRAITIGALSALIGAVVVAPAQAAGDCSTVVSSAAEYVAALACANDSDSATVITLGADIAVEGDDDVEYVGENDLTLDGAGHTISQADESESNVQFLSVPSDAQASLAVFEITGLTVTGFGMGYPLSVDTGSHLFITDSNFIDNGSQLGFAGTVRTSIPTTIHDSVWSGNTGLYGSALHTQAATLIGNSTFDGNTAYGTIIESFHALEIRGSTFSGNDAANDAVIRQSHDAIAVYIENSTFVNNTSSEGVIRINGAGTGSIFHSTFASNTASSGPANLAVQRPTTITGTVFANDSAVPSCTMSGSGSITSTYTFDADGSCTNNWSDATDMGEDLDPLLGSLADNGAPTLTVAPLEGSPLIDAIPIHAGSPVVVDQRGIERPQGTGYDIGAFEVEVDDDGDGEGDDEGGEDGEDEDQNGDGQDGADAGLVTFQVKTDGGTLYGTASPAIAVTDINWTSTAKLTGAPANTALPYGAAGFTVQVPEPGDSVTITLTAPAPFTSAYKVTNGQWANIDGATFSADGTTITYTLTDGGELDEDGEANGFIVDPIALAVEATFTG